MSNLIDTEIAELYNGKNFNKSRILNVGYENGDDQFIVDCVDFGENCNDKQYFMNLFRITPKLIEYWNRYGIRFEVYVDIDDDVITDSFIFKYKDTWTGFGRPEGEELIPSQQEIRIFRRIMDYITNMDEA